ncbi:MULTISPECIES: D-erythronate dehydrogenase [unclassified Nesterenkonia]|uniref:D-erythronate dehydrogenase n=1 Tax=unclassified Nesterenkonia TaxID=2629769 RepID=UPI000872784B|nr:MULTISPECIES: D-erythronate dehydrogenase [unclassified Nesterenkonia]MDS2172989.1 SDR family oxidoreductase [Nesterenkonia sp. CL21]OSM43847.1 NAD-dependent epimerase [Nesterenkonia sp. PF2B19]
MKALVTGGAGFLGSRVITALLEAHDAGHLAVEVDEVVSLDLAECPVDDPRVRSVVGDVGDPETLAQLVDAETSVIYHLAAVLSGGSEDDVDLALEVNVDATRNLLEAARAVGTAPRFVFTSSIAVFGGEMPDVVPETQGVQPESTYGATKGIGELLVNEYSRRGFVDARICRLPTISVRPGRPNTAVSSFASGIIREPLQGEEAVCPVPRDTRLWLSSPDTVVANLVHAARLNPEHLPAWRVLNLPGVTVTVAEMLDALEAVGGAEALARVSHEHDERISRIVRSWPGAFDVDRVLALGFRPDASFEDAVRQYHAEFVD